MQTRDNFAFYLLVNDSGLAQAHTRFAQQVRPHMPGDETWGFVEVILFVLSVFASSPRLRWRCPVDRLQLAERPQLGI